MCTFTQSRAYEVRIGEFYDAYNCARKINIITVAASATAYLSSCTRATKVPRCEIVMTFIRALAREFLHPLGGLSTNSRHPRNYGRRFSSAYRRTASTYTRCTYPRAHFDRACITYDDCLTSSRYAIRAIIFAVVGSKYLHTRARVLHKADPTAHKQKPTHVAINPNCLVAFPDIVVYSS